MTICRPCCDTVSTMTLRFGSLSRTRNTDVPPMPSSGFTTTSSWSSMNCAIESHVARDERRRDELAELRDRELLVVIADRARAVEDARALVLGAFEQVRRVDVLHVERRVLAHDHRAEVGELAQDAARPRDTSRGRRRGPRAAARGRTCAPASHRRSRCSIANSRCRAARARASSRRSSPCRP